MTPRHGGHDYASFGTYGPDGSTDDAAELARLDSQAEALRTETAAILAQADELRARHEAGAADRQARLAEADARIAELDKQIAQADARLAAERAAHEADRDRLGFLRVCVANPSLAAVGRTFFGIQNPLGTEVTL